jgi:hypothetical protein
MSMNATLDRINKLAEERSQLYRAASNGHRGDPKTISRIQEIDGRLEALWTRRRRERMMERDDIDRMIDSVYEQLYGTAAEYQERKEVA